MAVVTDAQADLMTQLAALADAAAVECEWPHQIADSIVNDLREDETRQRLAGAFRFFASGSGAGEERFGPMVTFDSGASIPGPLSDVSDETCVVWAAVAERSMSSRVQARLHDLLFERRWNNVGQHGAAAVDAYLSDAGQIDPPSLRTVDALRRAYQLARLLGRSDLLDVVIEALLLTARASASRPDPKAGVLLTLIELLVDAGCEDPVVADLLNQARDLFPGASNTESTIELQRRRAADDTSRIGLDRELIERWLQEADNADPLAALVHREKAAQLARERGQTDLADRAVRAMQEAEPPELNRIRVEVPSTVTSEQIEESIESMVGDDWWDSVGRMLAAGPPSGNVVRNREQAAERAAEFPLQALLPKVRLGGDGLPRYSAQSEEDQLDDQLTEAEAIGMQWIGQVMAEALRRACERFDPSIDDVVEALRSVNCPTPTAHAIGRVVQRFKTGDLEGATYTAIPLIERQCRELLLSINAPLYRVQRQRTPGTYPGLGILLPELARRGLDESWYRFLRTLLFAANGWNLRNEALHGFVEDVDATTAGLVLIALLYTSHLQPTLPASGHSDHEQERDHPGEEE